MECGSLDLLALRANWPSPWPATMRIRPGRRRWPTGYQCKATGRSHHRQAELTRSAVWLPSAIWHRQSFDRRWRGPPGWTSV